MDGWAGKWLVIGLLIKLMVKSGLGILIGLMTMTMSMSMTMTMTFWADFGFLIFLKAG